MTRSADYQARIQTYGQAQLLQLWEAIKNRHIPDWPSGKALEYLVLRAFQLEGANVTYPYDVRVGEVIAPYDLKNRNDTIEQIDDAIYCDGLACLVETKDQMQPIKVDPIAKMRNQLQRRHASTIGVVFSRSGFTSPVFIFAQSLSPQMVLLWNGEEIEYSLTKSHMRDSLVKKYRACIEKGTSDFNVISEETL
ncbi:MAG: hypothetical protein F6K31_37015 [Symploca sp. SIO2G7]|nr:hypothetical protein [Symploca sp. SIO2G7]